MKTNKYFFLQSIKTNAIMNHRNKQQGKQTMSKLIQKYKENPTEANLKKIGNYAKKHPFAWMMITKEEALSLPLVIPVD